MSARAGLYFQVFDLPEEVGDCLPLVAILAGPEEFPQFRDQGHLAPAEFPPFCCDGVKT